MRSAAQAVESPRSLVDAMTNIPVPIEVTQKISELAVRRAREGLQRRGWSDKSQSALQPAPAPGKVGIRATRKYLIYQERGTRPFLMSSLEGKTVPIKGKFFRVRGVGLPGMGYQNRKYDAHKGPIWRDERWKHPGIKPERFMQNAISQAILETRPTLQAEVMKAISGGDQ